MRCLNGIPPSLRRTSSLRGVTQVVLILCFIYTYWTWVRTQSTWRSLLGSRKWYQNEDRKIPTHKIWPPDEVDELYRPHIGVYSVSLKPWVDTAQKIRNPTVSYVNLLRSIYNDSNVNMSDLEGLAQLDRVHRIDGHGPNFQLYPKVLDLHAIVSNIRSGKPVDQNPINDPELLVFQAPDTSCGSSDDSFLLDHRTFKCDLIVVVKSCVSCWSQRLHARLTYMQKKLWVGFRVGFIFVTGLPFTLNSSSYIVQDVELLSMQHVKTTIELKQQRAALFNESQIYNDILIGGFRDSYENLTMKVIFALRWASVFCKHCSPLFMFMDSDVSLIPKNFVKFAKSMPDEDQREVIGGFSHPGGTIARPKGRRLLPKAKAISRKQFPWHVPPPYLHGHGYLLGSEKVRDAAIASAFIESFRLEDIYMGIVWDRLGYKCLKIPGFQLNPTSESALAISVITATKFADSHVDWKTGEIMQKVNEKSKQQ